jgi:hypothetical protein
MCAASLTVLLSIKPGHESDIQKIIDKLDADQPRLVTIDFKKDNLTHFARFVVLDDPVQGKERKRLLFAAVYDGGLKKYLNSLVKNTSDMDAFWGHCKDYNGVGNFYNLIETHNNPPNTFLGAFPNETVGSIQGYLKLRDELSKQFDIPLRDHAKVIQKLPRSVHPFFKARRFLKRTIASIRAFPAKVIGVFRLVALIGYGFNFWEAFQRVVLLQNRQLPLTQIYSEAPLDRSGIVSPFGEYTDPKTGIVYSDEVVTIRQADSLPSFLDGRVVQNQLAVVTINVPPDVRRQLAITALIQRGSNLIAGGTRIPTIHFGAWTMVDDNRRLLFLSHYDGSWENYIGDFVDRANVPVDAFWGGSIGWRDAGSRDIEFFKEGIRCHQTCASYFFSAYPTATVTGIARARQISELYYNNVDDSTTKELLKLL